jgi:hypothetical protein
MRILPLTKLDLEHRDTLRDRVRNTGVWVSFQRYIGILPLARLDLEHRDTLRDRVRKSGIWTSSQTYIGILPLAKLDLEHRDTLRDRVRNSRVWTSSQTYIEFFHWQSWIWNIEIHLEKESGTVGFGPVLRHT